MAPACKTWRRVGGMRPTPNASNRRSVWRVTPVVPGGGDGRKGLLAGRGIAATRGERLLLLSPASPGEWEESRNLLCRKPLRGRGGQVSQPVRHGPSGQVGKPVLQAAHRGLRHSRRNRLPAQITRDGSLPRLPLVVPNDRRGRGHRPKLAQVSIAARGSDRSRSASAGRGLGSGPKVALGADDPWASHLPGGPTETRPVSGRATGPRSTWARPNESTGYLDGQPGPPRPGQLMPTVRTPDRLDP